MDRRIHHSSVTLVVMQDQVEADLGPEVVMVTTKGRDIDVASARYPSLRGNDTSTPQPTDETLLALSSLRNRWQSSCIWPSISISVKYISIFSRNGTVQGQYAQSCLIGLHG